MAFNFPIVLSKAGLQPQNPVDIRAQLVANVAATNPGYTPNLPGSLIEDIASTDVAAIVLCDQAKVELVNSLTPNGANQFLLKQLGRVYGVIQNQPTNTSVEVVFSGTVGYVIPNGFLVSDGAHRYQVQGGGVIGGGGSSIPITAIATDSGSWGVAANSVVQLLTSVPSGVALTVTNPITGTPGGADESDQSFRTRILQAGQAAAVGTPRFIKTLVGKVPGVKPNLISVQQSGGGLRVIVGGGDVYQVAYAIFMAVGDITALVGSGIDGARDVTVGLNDYPDNYSVKSVNPPEQTVTIGATWNTDLAAFTGGSAFPELVQAPLTDYINGIGIGQPINVLAMNEIFQTAVQDVLDPSLLTRLVFVVSINGTPTAPTSGTYAIPGDAEGYFFTTPPSIAVVQG